MSKRIFIKNLIIVFIPLIFFLIFTEKSEAACTHPSQCAGSTQCTPDAANNLYPPPGYGSLGCQCPTKYYARAHPLRCGTDDTLGGLSKGGTDLMVGDTIKFNPVSFEFGSPYNVIYHMQLAVIGGPWTSEWFPTSDDSTFYRISSMAGGGTLRIRYLPGSSTIGACSGLPIRDITFPVSYFAGTPPIPTGPCAIYSGVCKRPVRNQCGITTNYETGEQLYQNCNPSACCTATMPDKPVLSSPAYDYTLINSTTMNLQWLGISDWGEGCTTDPRYLVQWKRTSNCLSTTGYSSQNVGTSTSYNLSSLSENSTYCWKVGAKNGTSSQSLTNTSNTWRFHTCTQTGPTNLNQVLPLHQEKLKTYPGVSWTLDGGWGEDCSVNTNKRYFLEWWPSDMNCTAPTGSIQSTTINTPTAETSLSYAFTKTQIQKNQYYCWRVSAVKDRVGTPNTLSVQSATRSFIVIADPFMITYGGDVYIGASGIPSDMKYGIQYADDPLGVTDYDPQTNDRFSTILQDIDNKKAYFSTSLFLTQSSAFPQTSYLGAELTGFTDTSSQEYTQPLTIRNNYGYNNITFNENFYSYYYASLEDKIRDVVYTNTSYDLKYGRAIGTTIQKAFKLPNYTSGKDKQVVRSYVLTNQTANVESSFTLKAIKEITAQVGFDYNDPDAADLRSSDDWAATYQRKYSYYTPYENIYCDTRSLILIPGDLTISANILNQDEDSSCVFIIAGHLTIELPDKWTPNPYYLNNDTYDGNYRIVEGLFLANSYTIKGKDDQGRVIINGGIITHDSAPSNYANTSRPNFFVGTNKHVVKTEDLNKPQEIYIYDPRHIMIWADELKGNLTNPPIREQRYLELVKN